jgi:hypothetical protein
LMICVCYQPYSMRAYHPEVLVMPRCQIGKAERPLGSGGDRYTEGSDFLPSRSGCVTSATR